MNLCVKKALWGKNTWALTFDFSHEGQALIYVILILKRKLLFCLLWEYGTVGERVGENSVGIQTGLEWKVVGNVRITTWMLLKVRLKGTGLA